MSTTISSVALHQAALHAAFCQCVLPAVEHHARFAFRHAKSAEALEDAVQEAVGLSWKWFVRLAERGKDATAFPSALATYAARAVKTGRRVCGHERKREALSPVAQRLHGFAVGKLPDFSTLDGNPLEEALHDNAVTPPDEAAAFRLDFPAWLTTLSHRDRDLVTDMGLGERTLALADKYGCSPGRISQKRRQFHDGWGRFHGDAV